MKASELRKGNYVNWNGEFINGITTNSIHLLDIGTIEGEITPIPLTEEWLIKLGFWHEDYYNRAKRYISKSPIILFKNNAHFELCFYPNCEIKYVHEMQNIYYVIMKEELVLAVTPKGID